MKKSLYRLAYRIVSRLSDLTGGWSFLVKWKIALAVVIMGLSAATLTSCPKTSCYAPEPTCYDPAPTCYITPEEPCPEPEDGNNPETGSTAEFDSDHENGIS